MLVLTSNQKLCWLDQIRRPPLIMHYQGLPMSQKLNGKCVCVLTRASPQYWELSTTVYPTLKRQECRSVGHWSIVLLETQRLERRTLRPASRPLYAYSDRTLCSGSRLETFVWNRTCGRYALLTGVSRAFDNFGAFLTGLMGVAILLPTSHARYPSDL